MKKAISVALSLIMLILLVCPAFAAEDGIVLANNGITAYQIVIGENASATEVNAAEILADYGLTEEQYIEVFNKIFPNGLPDDI